MGKRGDSKRARAQVSLEFSIILGFATLMIIPTIIVFYTQIKETSDRFVIQQAGRVARQIADEAEKVYYNGVPSKSLLKVYIPRSVQSISITNNEVVLSLKISNSTSEIAAPCRVNISGSIKSGEGFRYIKFEASESGVNISG